MRTFLYVGLCLLLVFSGCMADSPSSSRSSGVDLRVINAAEIAHVYAPFSQLLQEPLVRQGEDFVRIFDLNVLVHNRGYADSLVALYITGFDPNLFEVVPLGPYVQNIDTRFCYKDISIRDSGTYSVYALCTAFDDLLLGGGVSVDPSSTRFSVEGYRLNIGNWLAALTERVTGIENNFFTWFGDLFNGINFNCNFETNPRDENTRRGTCSISSSFLDFVSGSHSRGALLLALYGGDVRACGNGCILVPSPRVPRPFLAGNTARYPGGEMQYIDFGVFLNRGRWPINLEEHSQLFQISACYLYTTYVTPTVCIDPAPGRNTDGVCRSGVQALSQNQQAPLRVTHIEQSNQGPRIMFTIHVQDTRGGRVFHPGAIDFCAPSAPETFTRELRDMAKVIDARILGSLESLSCQQEGNIRLTNGRGSINCFYDIPASAFASGPYQTTLNIEIGYLYREIQTVRSVITRI